MTGTRRNNRVTRVDRVLQLGTKSQLAHALLQSEDSETLNTSFVERMNLTIRQGSAYLQRRSPCHARCERALCEHEALLRAYYNFVRPHRGLKFGPACKTPAMQTGLTDRPLSFRDIFTLPGFSRQAAAVIQFPHPQDMTETDRFAIQLAA